MMKNLLLSCNTSETKEVEYMGNLLAACQTSKRQNNPKNACTD